MFHINYYTIFLKDMEAESFLEVRKDKSLFFMAIYIVVNMGSSSNIGFVT